MIFLFECKVPCTVANFLGWLTNFLLKQSIINIEFRGDFVWHIDPNIAFDEYRGQKIYTIRAEKHNKDPIGHDHKSASDIVPIIYLTIVETTEGIILVSFYQPEDTPLPSFKFINDLKEQLSFAWPEIARTLLDAHSSHPLDILLFEYVISLDPLMFLDWCKSKLDRDSQELYSTRTGTLIKDNSVYTMILLPDKNKPIWECVVMSWESTFDDEKGDRKRPLQIRNTGKIASIELRNVSSTDYQVICQYNSGYEHLKDWLWNLGKEISEIYSVAPRQIAGKMVERKVGRPHLPEDIWAWQQVNIEGRSKREVHKEWKELPEVKKRGLADETRHFNHITHHEWMSKRNK